ncbi:choline dehydrogenase [Lojkania enalia]|uniref:Choline dehydrogenase n=1 Tax=Lojkania enalia TaxID=147567 RepID=A0A9P4K1L7_9PLEO|nr:choline dehydrogenase [Didymosphaeria enalia]
MASLSADYIIVGGGLTGCAVASRIAQSSSKPSVILLEAGPDPTGEAGTDTILAGLSLLGGKLDYAYQSDPVTQTAGRTHTLNAGKTLGGGSILNFGGWLPADSKDYDDWGKIIGDQRWSYKGMKPWLEKVDGHFGAAHISSDPERKYPLRNAVEAAWNELGVKPANTSSGSMTGLSELKENVRNGLRQPSYAAYPLDGVTVLTNTSAHRVTFTGVKANGVELTDGRVAKANKEVILCSGAYRTPQILMLSGIGPPEVLSDHGIDLKHASPYVGENLFDHFAVYLAFRLRDPSQNLALGSPGWTNPSLFKGMPYDWVASETVPQHLVGKDAASLDLQGRNLFEVLTVYVPPGIPGIPVDGTHIATSTMLLLPTSRGSVSISSSSPNDLPKVRPNYLSTDTDRQVLMYAARQTLKAILDTGGMKQLVESETPPSGPGLDGLTPLTSDVSDDVLRERIERTGMQHHHSGGTAAMGKVVDAEGKVLGVDGLRVADASVVPVPLGGHPQATLYAMVEQLASFIIQ